MPGPLGVNHGGATLNIVRGAKKHRLRPQATIFRSSPPLQELWENGSENDLISAKGENRGSSLGRTALTMGHQERRGSGARTALASWLSRFCERILVCGLAVHPGLCSASLVAGHPGHSYLALLPRSKVALSPLLPRKHRRQVQKCSSWLHPNPRKAQQSPASGLQTRAEYYSVILAQLMKS